MCSFIDSFSHSFHLRTSRFQEQNILKFDITTVRKSWGISWIRVPATSSLTCLLVKSLYSIIGALGLKFNLYFLVNIIIDIITHNAIKQKWKSFSWDINGSSLILIPEYVEERDVQYAIRRLFCFTAKVIQTSQLGSTGRALYTVVGFVMAYLRIIKFYPPGQLLCEYFLFTRLSMNCSFWNGCFWQDLWASKRISPHLQPCSVISKQFLIHFHFRCKKRHSTFDISFKEDTLVCFLTPLAGCFFFILLK